MDLGHDLRELLGVGYGHDGFHVLLDGGEALAVQTGRVEPHGVEVGDLLLDAPLLGRRLGHLREELVDAHLVVLAQDVKGAVTRKFGFERVFLLPSARGVLIEILIGGYRRVEVRRIDCRNRGLLLLAACGHKSNH